jgi:hypothetical protein
MKSLLQFIHIILYYKCFYISSRLLIEVYLCPIHCWVHDLLEVILIWKIQSLSLSCIQIRSFVFTSHFTPKGTTRHKWSSSLHNEIILTLTRYHKEMLFTLPLLWLITLKQCISPVPIWKLKDRLIPSNMRMLSLSQML